jgi:hypothetical protein
MYPSNFSNVHSVSYTGMTGYHQRNTQFHRRFGEVFSVVNVGLPIV